ncbi:hypothetical protein [Microbacterium stercoris]|uniref:Uncharacterized protein n=1 Tax=Microbacterium stercoris TaxID=2820289 RepID=A0A939TUI2_9MICO|nr:hypothetical protein [Microbacterium stercoris]MBO3664064.1 hypothetical protein [Microbacterium stercoris]
MYIDPMIGILRYEEDVRRAEERIRMIQALEERQAAERSSARRARRTEPRGLLRALLPHHS